MFSLMDQRLSNQLNYLSSIRDKVLQNSESLIDSFSSFLQDIILQIK